MNEMYSDEVIEQLGNRFCELNLFYKYGIRFETYVRWPDTIEASLKYILPLPRSMQQKLQATVH